MSVEGVEFRMNPTFERDLLARNPDLAVSLAARGRVVAGIARDLAHKLSGALADSVAFEVGVAPWGALGIPRVIAHVYATDFKAHFHEFGTRKMPAHPFLLPALRQGMPGASIRAGSR